MAQSEAFDTSDWVTTNTNVTTNATTSPAGLQDADKLEFTATNSEISEQFTNVASSMHIGTMFLKNNDINKVELELIGGTPNLAAEVTVDLRDGTLTLPTGDYTPTIEDYGNGWWRVAIGDTSNASVASPAFKIKSVGTNFGSFYAYGVQMEAGSYATSYIPTYGTAATRVADAANKTGISSLINSPEGVLYLELSTLTNSGGYRSIGLNSGSATNRLLLTYTSTTNQLNYLLQVAGVTEVNITHTLTSSTSTNKIAAKWKAGDFALWVNGVEVSTATGSSYSASTLTTFSFDNANGVDLFQGNLNQTLLFPTALTDTELATLTTL
tara:strand:- start:4 stop:981 length:978 start_codon:yes stop_codon:yes gene_type:complete